MKFLLLRLLELVAPERCAGCGTVVSMDRHCLCERCFNEITPVSDGCARCSGPLVEGRCILCSGRAFYPKENIAMAEYRGVMKKIMGQYKFSGARRLHRHFARMIELRIPPAYFKKDCISAVPLESKSQWRRGYNQSELIARSIASRRGIPYLTLLKRRRGPNSQKSLGSRDRFFNVLDSFHVVNPEKIRGKSVILMDDIFTTGATINECARVLMQAGADEVSSLTIARAAECRSIR